MPPPRFLFARRLCSASASDTAAALTPSTISDAAELAAATALRAPSFESRLLSLVPGGVLSDPDFARLTLARLLPVPGPSLRFLRFVSSRLPDPAPDAASAGASPALPEVHEFLLRLPPHLAADAVDLLASHLGIHLSVGTINAASRAALRAARPDLVFRLFSAFSSSPDYPGDVTTVGCLARAYAAQGRPLEGLQLLRDAARRGSAPPGDAAADIVAAFADNGNWAKVSATLHLMITAGCTPDIVVYQRIVHALFAQRNCGEALRVFREIKQRGYDIDRVMYTTMIHGLCKMNRIGDAQQVWDEMVDKGLEPNEYTYCSLVNYYCKAGDFEKARKLYDEMLEKGFKQTTLTCNIFIKGFCAHERVYEALEVFEEMSVKGIKHDVITYNTLIWGLCKAGMLPQAIRMYEWLPSSGLEPSALTLSPLIATVCKEGQLEAAAKLIMSMRARGLEPSQWSNDNIINVFCKIGRPDEGMAWLAGMLKNNIKPRRQTFDSLVCSLSTSGRVDDALLVLDIMLKHGASDACSKLYVMRRFLYCRMVEGLSVVKQARKIHMLAMDVRHCSKENPYVLPDEFVAGAIISKLPSSWKDFATSLKHKRQEFTIDGLIGALDIEEKARAKDTRGKRVVGASANFVQKNSNGQKNNSHKGKKKPQLPPNHSKAKQTTLDIEEKTKAKDTCGKRVAAASANYVQKNDNDQKNNSHEGENKAQEPPNHSEAKQMIIEEKARAKDTRGKRVVGASANFVQKNSNGQKNNSHKGKKKPQQPPNHSKAKQTTLDIEEKTRAKDTCGKRVAGASANFVQKNDNDLKNNSHEGEKKAQEPPNHSEAKQTILDVEENARAKETRGKKVVGARANFVQKKNNGQKNNSHKGNKKPQQPPNHSKAKKTILDVEENARAKETRGKKVVGASANLVQKNNNDQKNNSQEGKKKPQQLPNHSMAKQTTTFKKKRKGFLCYVCGSQDHFAKKCPDHPSAKSANMVVSEASGTSGSGGLSSC